MGILGVDIGGTKVGLRFEAGASSPSPSPSSSPSPSPPSSPSPSPSAGAGPLFARADWPVDGGVEADLAVLADLVERTSKEWGHPLEAVGVAVPGTVTADGTLVTWPGRPSWVGLDLRTALHNIFGEVPVYWADDGDLGALAEARHAGCDNLVYLGVGTGVGGGIVIGGRTLPGFARGSCELGHIVVDLDGPVCDCGRQGCVQAFAGGPAILRRAGALRHAATEDSDLLTPEALRTAWSAREDWAVRALDAAAVALATAVVVVSEMLHPEVALIGGGFAAAHPGFVDLVEHHVQRLVRPGQTAIAVRPAALDGLSSLRGAVELARTPG